jgi:hypothetical protein
LPEREQQVLILYYREELTMRAVDEMMGIGESRVLQIHTQAVKHLRAVTLLQEAFANRRLNAPGNAVVRRKLSTADTPRPRSSQVWMAASGSRC